MLRKSVLFSFLTVALSFHHGALRNGRKQTKAIDVIRSRPVQPSATVRQAQQQLSAVTLNDDVFFNTPIAVDQPVLTLSGQRVDHTASTLSELHPGSPSGTVRLSSLFPNGRESAVTMVPPPVVIPPMKEVTTQVMGLNGQVIDHVSMVPDIVATPKVTTDIGVGLDMIGSVVTPDANPVIDTAVSGLVSDVMSSPVADIADITVVPKHTTLPLAPFDASRYPQMGDNVVVAVDSPNVVKPAAVDPTLVQPVVAVNNVPLEPILSSIEPVEPIIDQAIVLDKAELVTDDVVVIDEPVVQPPIIASIESPPVLSAVEANEEIVPAAPVVPAVLANLPPHLLPAAPLAPSVPEIVVPYQSISAPLRKPFPLPDGPVQTEPATVIVYPESGILPIGPDGEQLDNYVIEATPNKVVIVSETEPSLSSVFPANTIKSNPAAEAREIQEDVEELPWEFYVDGNNQHGGSAVVLTDDKAFDLQGDGLFPISLSASANPIKSTAPPTEGSPQPIVTAVHSNAPATSFVEIEVEEPTVTPRPPFPTLGSIATPFPPVVSTVEVSPTEQSTVAAIVLEVATDVPVPTEVIAVPTEIVEVIPQPTAEPTEIVIAEDTAGPRELDKDAVGDKAGILFSVSIAVAMALFIF